MTNRILAAFAALLLWTAPLSAQTSEDAAAIETTILSQIEAMQADEWDEAFSFASPTIQGIFRSPFNFSEMVKKGYPMVWQPSDVQVGDLTPTPRGPMQTMFFVDQQGRAYVADYLMQLVDGQWRINGVQIRPAEAGSA